LTIGKLGRGGNVLAFAPNLMQENVHVQRCLAWQFVTPEVLLEVTSKILSFIFVCYSLQGVL